MARGASIKNLTSIITLEDIVVLNSQILVGRMVKPHLSMLANLFYNVVKLVLMMR
jgi:hypothetical protein